MEIPMMAAVIARVNELGSGKPELLTWTNLQGETIGDGPSWDTTETRNDKASITSASAGATEEDDDDDVLVAEEDRGAMPTTDVDVVDKKVNTYLGMEMDFNTKGEVHITMLKHLDDAVKTFEEAQAKFSEGFIKVERKKEQGSAERSPKGLVCYQ
jgi:hypothetical protein